MTDWLMVDPTSVAFSPTLLAHTLAAEVKLLQPEAREAHGSDSSSCPLWGGAGVFPNPVYRPPWLGGRSLQLCVLSK